MPLPLERSVRRFQFTNFNFSCLSFVDTFKMNEDNFLRFKFIYEGDYLVLIIKRTKESKIHKRIRNVLFLLSLMFVSNSNVICLDWNNKEKVMVDDYRKKYILNIKHYF